MKVLKVLKLLELFSGPDIIKGFKQERFQPADCDAFIVDLVPEEHENEVALDIISRNALYANLPAGTDGELIMNVRQIANYAFLKGEFEEALGLYKTAIEITKNVPILFNSRALCFIRLGNFKRAIIDCDYVINKLDERNLNSWMFRANGYYGLGICSEYEKSVAEALKNHPKRLQYINDVVSLISATFDKQQQKH